MTTFDGTKDMYNQFKDLPTFSYECIKYLMNNNDLVWKLLKYNDKDAWKSDASHPNLSIAQKGALIYNGASDQTPFRVFLDFGQDSAMTEQGAFLRISPVELIPKNYIQGNVTMAFEIYTHYLCNTLSNYQPRLDTMVQQLIEVFNGADISGLGRIYFDARANPKCRMSIGGEIPFRGKIITMCNWIA
jgi:hypothetical protein